MARLFILAGTISGFISVALGAFAAHGLKEQLSPLLLNTFKTGVEYQFMHALALILIAIVMHIKPTIKLYQTAGIAFLIGILLFSGSLYILALTGLKYFGIITPIGGVAFLIGWVYFTLAAWKSF